MSGSTVKSSAHAIAIKEQVVEFRRRVMSELGFNAEEFAALFGLSDRQVRNIISTGKVRGPFLRLLRAYELHPDLLETLAREFSSG